MQRVFKLYTEPSQSFESVALAMRRMGITTRKGRPYYKSQVQRILSNPVYIGINRFNGKDYPGAQEPIISKRLFDLVQQKMHAKRPTRYRKHNPIFKNLIHCSNCGGLVTWQLQKGHYYGTCQRASAACKGRKLLREDNIEAMLVTMLEKLVSPSEKVITWVAEAMRERHHDRIDNDAKLASSMRLQIERLARMDNNLYDDKIAGEITPKRYAQKHADITAEKAALEERLSKIDQLGAKRLEQRLVLLELSQKAAQIFPTRTPEQKRIIITKHILTQSEDETSLRP